MFGFVDAVKEDVLWTEKYQPQHSCDVIGNMESVRKLHRSCLQINIILTVKMFNPQFQFTNKHVCLLFCFQLAQRVETESRPRGEEKTAGKAATS